MSFLRRLFGASPAAPVQFIKAERGNTWVEVAGESHHEEAIARFAGPKTPDGVNVWVVAALVPEPTNSHDRNAVAVQIEGIVVGYLAREVAPRFHQLMREDGFPGYGMSGIRAKIRAGWKRPGDEGSYSMTLYMKSRVANLLNGAKPEE